MCGALNVAACSLRSVQPTPCYEVIAQDGEVRPQHPSAVWLLQDRHGEYNEDRFMLRLALPQPADPAPRFWQRRDDGALYIHVMGGMWGDHFELRETSLGFEGTYRHTTDMPPGAYYRVVLRPIACESTSWGPSGPRMDRRLISM